MDAVHGISVALLRPLAELLGRLDADPAAFLAALDVDEAMPPNAYVAAERVDEQLAQIAKQQRDPAFGLTLARASLVRPLGLFGHLVWLSGTVRDALERAAKFYLVVTQRTKLHLEDAPPISTLRMVPVTRRVKRGRILTELPFASLALRAREATGGKFALRAVRFTHAGQSSPAYAEVFGAPVTFRAPRDEIEMHTADLDLRLASHDPIVSAALEARAAELTEAGAPRSVFLERVRRAIAANLAATHSPVEIARALGTSPRTLRRHLEQAGTNLRVTVDEVRRERADLLLAGGSSIKETAFALGFSEPSAFSRAYKRWTGEAPSGRSES